MKVNLKSKIAAISLLAFSNLVGATEAVPLSTADLDRVTAGSQPLFQSVAGILSTFYSDLNRPRLDEFLRLLGQPVAIGQLDTDLLAALRRLNPIEWVPAANQLKPGEAVSFRQNPDGSVSTAQINPGNIVSTMTLTPGEPVWIRQVTSGGVSYTYVGRNGNVVLTRLN
jgi:hypothetical protein